MAIKTSPYGAPELRELLGKLERLTKNVRDALAWVEETGEPLFVFKKSSQVDGVKRFRGFEQELVDSLIAAQSGRPYTAETLKPRAGTQPAPRSTRQEEEAKIAQEADELVAKQGQADRAAKRGAPKKATGQSAKSGRKKKSG